MENIIWEDDVFRIVEKRNRYDNTTSYLLQTSADVEFGQKRYWLNIEMGNDVETLKQNTDKWI
jgi:hypothetical protein